jgi:hypothetical protein
MNEHINSLWETLTTALEDAQHYFSVDKPTRARMQLEVAEKTMEAIKLAEQKNPEFSCSERRLNDIYQCYMKEKSE